MAAGFAFWEDNGTLTSGHGATQATSTDTNWKNIDDNTSQSGTLYSAAPIQAGNNSFCKFQYGKFSGTYNQISAGLWSHTAGVFGTGLTLKGVVSSTYTTPGTAANGSLTVDMTAVLAIASGQTVLFSATGPNGSTSSTLSSGGGTTQYLISQLQTLGTAAAGDSASIVMTLQYSEN